MNRTNIPWADFTWNPITGCTRGCDYCYARGIAKRFGNSAFTHSDVAHIADERMMAFPFGFAPTIYPHRLDEPLHRKKPSVIFLGSMGDLFDPAFPDEFRDRVFATIAAAPRHTFMLLTKRAPEMLRYFNGWIWRKGPFPLHNLWFGVTVTNQADADERIPLLLGTPAAHRFVSVEPMLGPVDIRFAGHSEIGLHVLQCGIDLVIVGGKTPGKPLHEQTCLWESDGQRPIEMLRCITAGMETLRSLRDQCLAAGVPFHYKHGGTNPPLDGVVYDWNPRRRWEE